MKRILRNGRLIAIPTLPVTSCDDCGACCMHMGTPPGYASYYAPLWGNEIADWAKESPDYQRWLALPANVEAELRSYYAAVQAGTLDDRTRNYVDADALAAAVKAGRVDLAAAEMAKVTALSEIPCLWFDAETRRCRHYDHRPETCRDAIEPGDEACLATRRAHRIPLPVTPPVREGV